MHICLLMRMALAFTLFLFAGSRVYAQDGSRPEKVRYGGADGVELSYPTTWSRARSANQQEASGLLLVRLNDQGAVVARFRYTPIDLSGLPEADRNARFFAQATVAAAREENPEAVLKDVTPATLGAKPGSYFELLRPGPDGKPLVTLNWAVTWSEAHLLFTVAVEPGDVASRAEAEGIVKSISFSDSYAADDGKSVIFHDRAGRVTMTHPSHWHDEPPPRAALAQWGIYDKDGTKHAVVQLISDRIKGEQTAPQEFLTAMARQMATILDDVEPEPAEAFEVDGLKGHRQKLRAKSKEGEGRHVYLCVLEREGWFVVLSATVANEVNEQFEARWQSVLKSIRLD